MSRSKTSHASQFAHEKRIVVGPKSLRPADTKRWNPNEEIRRTLIGVPVIGWFFRGHKGAFSYQRIIAIAIFLPIVATLGWVASASARVELGQSQSPKAKKPTISEAEQVLHQFLGSSSWEGLLDHCRYPDKVRPLMLDWYEKHPYQETVNYTIVDAQEGMIGATDGSPVSERWVAMFKVLNQADDQGRVYNVELMPEGFKVDWETAVGFDEMPLNEFVETSPTREVVFRLNVGAGSYHNFRFEDATVWKSFGFVDPTGMHALHGFVEHGSTIESELSSYMVGTEFTPVIVGLQLPQAGQDVALITSVKQKGWIRDYGNERE